MGTTETVGTLVDALRENASSMPDHRAYSFLVDGEQDRMDITSAELDARSKAIAAALQGCVANSERALLLFPPGLDFVVSFYGCLYAGVCAVPCYLPSVPRAKSNSMLDRFVTIARDCNASVILTTSELMDKLQERWRKFELDTDILWLATDTIHENRGQDWVEPSISGDTLAYLQYTSGSTSVPKGVMVTHANLINNSRMMQKASQSTAGVEIVSWLPVFHDMGLIGAILQSQLLNGSCTFMTPQHFIKKPIRWLQLISQCKNEHIISGGPNFAYDLCVREISEKDMDSLDLSRWKTAFNGSEPVRRETVDSFIEKFKRCGFQKSAMHPTYGLAETTLMVSGRQQKEPQLFVADAALLEQGKAVKADPRNSRTKTLVGCGCSVEGQELLIVDPDTRQICKTGGVGEIWVSGPHVANGYWNQEAATENAFHAYTATGEGPLLRTGDLGFLNEEELYITGRIKEVIIIRGRNLYPQDVERSAGRSHDSLLAGLAAAFAVEVEGEERLIVVQAVNRRSDADFSEVARKIRENVSEDHDVELYGVVLVKPSEIKRTTSGKIQRSLCRDAFLNESLEVIAQSMLGHDENEREDELSRKYLLDLEPMERRSVLEKHLKKKVADKLKVPSSSFGMDTYLTSLGIGSLSTFDLLGSLERQLDVKLTMGETLNDVVNEVLEQLEATPVSLPKVEEDLENRHQPFPLTDIQYAYFVGRSGAFELGRVSTHAYYEMESENMDLSRLGRAWQGVIRRHEMLRAVIMPSGEQRIMAEDEVPAYEIVETDLRGASPDEVNAYLQSVRDRMSHLVRPTEKWPLFEICATRLDDRVRVHFSFDLIVADVWSFRILLKEWADLYEQLDTILPPLNLSFRDYVLAEKKLESTELYEQSRKYWLSRLSQLPPAPELPMVQASGLEEKQPRFVRRSAYLPSKKWQTLKERGAKNGLTPSHILLAAFSQILAAWSKNQQFTLNVTLFNRLPIHPQFNEIVGDFTSVELLEVDLRNSGRGLEELAKDLQKQLWNDLEHSYFSGIRVLREMTRQHGGVRSVMPVVFTSALGQVIGEADDLPISRLGKVVYGVSQTPQVYLDHQVYEQKGDLAFNWDTIDDLFPAGMLDDMWNAYVGFLEDLAEREELWKERDYQWLPDDQLRQREEVNATQGRVPKDLLQAPFAEQAAMHPDHPALISSEGTLSYEELFRRANQLGRRLREEGVRPGMLVGVAIGKSWEQIVAVLGVLQAGGAYLAVDPDLPEERQVYLLEHGQVDVVLTCDGRPITGGWPEHVQVMAADLKGWEGAEGDPLEPVQSPDDLAYVIYTSGSTGQPKGVMISHRAALNTVLDINDRFEVGPKDAVLALSALHFDLSVYDIFGMLAAGGTIVLPEAEASRNPKRWLDLMQEHDVTIWNSVPALLEMLVEQASGEAVPPSLALRQVLLSGDWIPVYLPDRIKSLVKGVQVVSLGGATEASIWSIFYPIGEVDSKWESIPYGKPLTNQTFAVLNERMEPCPVWVPGQLYIGGLGLAKGYWRDEEKTAAHFIEHPETGERLYRTGDLGRYLPDGNIEFLGREDFQVKVRGHRIELGEIESTLVQHPQVKQAVVAAVGADRNHKQLVGYVVPKEEQSLSEEELSVSMRELLESKLPSYMIPTHFMFLEGLPLTANGKVDRQALPDPERIVRSPLDENLANDELIEEIATIVSEVLGVETVGIHDNFFEMGGDSIMAIQIINKANARGYEVTPQDLFENQTIAQIATVVRKTEDKETDLSGSIPLAPFQRRLLEHGSGEIRPIFHRVNLELPTGIDQTLAEQTLLYLMKHHDPLRLRFIREESGWVQRTAEESDSVYIPFIDLSALSDEDQQEAMQQMTAEMMEEINPSEEAPIKVAVFELGKNRDQMVWIIHRLVMDETSWKILLEDFGTVYGQLSRGDEPMLPVQRSTFKQWVERTRLYGDFVAQQESEKWLQWASEEVTLLPAGDEKADSEEGSQSIRLTLSEQDTRGLLEDVSDAYRLSLSETALAALAKTLQDWTEKHRFLVEIEQEVREELFDDLNLKRSIGCFTSVYPLMLDLEEVEETDRLLKVVKEQIRTIPSSGIGYDFLRFGDDKAIATALRSSHQPQISFRNLGDLDWRLSEPFGGSHEPVFEQGSPLKGDRPLSLTVFLSNNQLHMIWTFHSGYTRETMETLAKGYIDNLQKILDHSRLVESVAYNPTDFPHAELNQDQLDALLSSFDKGK